MLQSQTARLTTDARATTQPLFFGGVQETLSPPSHSTNGSHAFGVWDPEKSQHVLRNRVLSALPADDLARVWPHVELVQLKQREPLFERETPIGYICFPETTVISLVSILEDGTTIEVGTAGNEGVVGLSVFLAGDSSSLRAFAQVPGLAWRLDARVFMRFAEAPGPLHQMLLRYTQAFLSQVSQTAACNSAHLLEERCARWLLMTHDRVTEDSFPMTHEFLAFMLGVRRAGVTVALRALKRAGVVDHSRGRMQIIDRAGLEDASCECYRVVRAHFDRLLPRGR